MTMKAVPIIILSVALSSAALAYQRYAPLTPPARPSAAAAPATPAPQTAALLAALDAEMDMQDDPAYSKYKEGYNAILDEEWRDAVKKLTIVLEAYPKSDYRDDAAYWRAYALMHFDRKQAMDAYNKFVKEYKQSSYYDDAVADLEQLNSGVTVVPSAHGATTVYVGPDSYAYGFSTDSTDDEDGETPAAIGRTSSESRLTAHQLRSLNRELQAVGKSFPRIVTMPALPRAPRAPRAPNAPTVAITGHPYSTSFWGKEEKLDPDTQLKLDALYALGDGKEDEKSFESLKRIALDRKQPREMRIAALDIVSNYRKFDVMPLYTEIAKTDTAEEIQAYVIDYISSNSKDKNKSVQTLIDLFNSTPKGRIEQRRQIFFAIADVGNDKAIDFLGNVARTGDSYELRREAVFYLGTMGTEKARGVLLEIMEGSAKR
jgi:hypothetical protein